MERGSIPATEAAFEALKDMLENIAMGIAAQFGSNCEVAVHNLTEGYTHTIDFIENGHVTGRKIGDDASEVVLEALKQTDLPDRYNYITHSREGKLLKSSTINIRDAQHKIIAVLSINYDISDMTVAANTIGEFLRVSGEEVQGGNTITNDVSELLDNLIEESRACVGKPVSAMSKDDKIKAITYLDRKGALLIKKSGEKIANYYGISKYTLYNYLGETGESD